MELDSEGCILVVEDERDIREFLVTALADEGHGVLAARNGRDALERLRRHRPRLILLDYNLGDLTGAQVAAEYRSLPGPHAPIVVVTAAHDARRRAAEVGADGFLPKPFDLDDLLGIVTRHVARAA